MSIDLIIAVLDTLHVGDFVEADDDFGTVVAVDGDMVTIAWDGSVQRSTQTTDGLERISARRYRELRRRV